MIEYPLVEFEMVLSGGKKQLAGTLTFWFGAHDGIAIPASAGLPGWQDFGHWMVKGKGPIPPSALLGYGRTYVLQLKPENRSSVKGIEGPFYGILPYEVPVSAEVVRTGFGFHKDGNVIGSAGCIVPVEAVRGKHVHFGEAEHILEEWGTRRTGVPLVVRYRAGNE